MTDSGYMIYSLLGVSNPGYKCRNFRDDFKKDQKIEKFHILRVITNTRIISSNSFDQGLRTYCQCLTD